MAGSRLGSGLRDPWVDGGCESHRIQNLSLMSGDNSIRASWNKPQYSGSSFRHEVKAYLVQWKAPGEEYARERQFRIYRGHHGFYDASSADGASFVIKEGLTPGVEYLVRVVPSSLGEPHALFDADGHQRYAEASVTVSSEPMADSAPQAPVGLRVGSRDQRLVVSWEPPEHSGSGFLSGYLLQWRSDDQSFDTQQRAVMLPPLHHKYDIEELANAKNYHVRLSAINNTSHSTPVTATATPLGPARHPPCIDYIARDGDLILSWEPPADNGGASVERYQVDVVLPGGAQNDAWGDFSRRPGWTGYWKTTQYTTDTTITFENLNEFFAQNPIPEIDPRSDPLNVIVAVRAHTAVGAGQASYSDGRYLGPHLARSIEVQSIHPCQ